MSREQRPGMTIFLSRWFVWLRAALGSATDCARVGEVLWHCNQPRRAVRYLARGALSGIPAAQALLAQAYLHGRGVPSAIDQAMRWLHAAADGGDQGACAQLAELALQGVTRQSHRGLFRCRTEMLPDWELASHFAVLAADAGSPHGKSLLGFIRSEGPAYLRDEAAAECLYRESAAAGWAPAQLGLGLLLMKHHKVAEAHPFLSLAAAASFSIAHYWLGVIAESGADGSADIEAAANHYRQASEGGCVPAQTRLGFALYHGRGLPRDRNAAETWLRRAAIAGDVQAAAVLGLISADAQEQVPNLIEAVAWLERSAEAGHIGAARSLAQLYRLGQGVRKDVGESLRWLRRAAAAGDPTARSDLIATVLAGAGEAEDRRVVARWLLMAAEAGDTGALFRLGYCAANGIAMPPDATVARTCFVSAAERGSADAAAAAGEMLINGRGGPADPPRGLAFFRQAAADGHAGALYALGVLQSDMAALRRSAEGGHPAARDMLAQLQPT